MSTKQDDADALIAKLLEDIAVARRLLKALTGRAGLAQLAAALAGEVQFTREETRATYTRTTYPKTEG